MISQNKLQIQDDQRAQRLSDLELFKMLLQPHFLFNSLNNLYALSIKKSDQTTEAIAGLSVLLEKVVASARRDLIPLSEELDLIEDYISMERIWLGETGFLLDFQVQGNTDEIQVPPLLLYTFVENCFKHGIRKCNGCSWLTLKVEVRDKVLWFKASNQVPAPVEGEGIVRGTGLGVLAVKELLDRRCNGNYSLENGRKGNVYNVKLRINSRQTA